MVHPLSSSLADTAKFTAAHAVLVSEADAALTWLVTGAVLMVQQASVMALSEARAELPAMPGPSELVARTADPAMLAQPYTAPLKPDDHRSFERLVAARNAVMHPGPEGVSFETAALPDGLMVATKAVRHLALTQPVRPSMMDERDAEALRDALQLIETSVAFWRSVLTIH